MWEICITIGGVRHCFSIPVLVPSPHPGPGPVNFPELELAIAVLQLVQVVQPSVQHSELTRQLSDVATRFIEGVQKGMPAGVELVQTGAQH